MFKGQNRRQALPGAGNKARPRHVGKHWKRKPAIIIRPDGREIFNRRTHEGRAKYKWHILLMWLRQDGYCCFRNYDFCPGELELSEATFQHEKLRGKDRDDRIVDSNGKPINGTAHGLCNSIAGSRRMPIWHGEEHLFL